MGPPLILTEIQRCLQIIGSIFTTISFFTHYLNQESSSSFSITLASFLCLILFHMATITSISNPFSSSQLYHKSHISSTFAYSLEFSFSCFTTKEIGIRNSRSINRAITIQNVATKQAKSPAEEEWKIKRKVLLEKKVRSMDAKEALRLQKENNFVILDVRPEAEFKEGHPEGAINVQIYRLIKEWTAWDIARRVAFAFFGIFAGTEENPEFIQSVESKIAKDAKIIVACSSGGTTKPTQNLPEGSQSRSLIAAYLLVLNGYTNVFHLEGGLYSWFKEGLPTIAEEEE